MTDVEDDTRTAGPQRDERVRLISFVAAIIIILFILLILIPTDYYRLDNDNETPDDIPQDLDPPPLVIDSDERWEGRKETLANPIIVRSGAKLEMVDCNLSVHLLELALGNQSWIAVEPGGELVLDDSDLSIWYEPQLEDAVVAFGNYYDDAPLSISRMVNLEDSEDPVLSLDLYWWRGNTTVLVAVQRDVGEDLELVTRIEPDEDTKRVWTHREVSLADYRDKAVRLVVFTNRSGRMDVIVGGLRVLDGTDDLLHDRFETGRAWEDGWLCDGFEPIFLPRPFRAPQCMPLAFSEGDVSVLDSVIRAPPGLPRWDLHYAASKHHDNPTEYIDLTVRMNDEDTSGGAHIWVEGGRLIINSSSVKNVPLIVRGSQFAIIDSHLLGDADLVAINASNGFIEGCTFTSVPFQAIQRTQYSTTSGRLDRGVAISFNRSEGPITIRDCLFSNSTTTLELNHAWVVLEGCEFIGYTEHGIWDHDTVGLGTYSDITSRNVIGEAEGLRYFRTHTSTFELLGPGRPAAGSSYGWFTGIVWWEGMEGYDDQSIVGVDSYQLHLLMPTLQVNPSGEEVHIHEVLVDVFTYWGGKVDQVLDSSLRDGTINLDQAFIDAYSFSYGRNEIDREESYAGAPGRVNVSLDIQVKDEYEETWFVIIFLDGEFLRMVGFDEADPPIYGNHNGYVNLTLDIPPGLHRLNYALLGQSIVDWEIEELWNETVLYYRVESIIEFEGVQAFVDMGNGTLLLDPDIHLGTDMFAPTGDVTRQSIDLVLSNGSSFAIGGASLPAGTRLYINASGNGTVTLSDIETMDLVLASRGVDIDAQDIVCERLWIRSFGNNFSLSRLVVTNRTDLSIHEAGEFLFKNSVIEVRHRIWYTELYAHSSNIIIDNVSFSAQARNEFPIVLLDNATLSLANSTFDGIIASVYTDSWRRTNVTARITGCDFTGSDAGLWMHDDYYNESMDIDFTEDSIVEGNSFSGEGCDLVCQFHLVDGLIGANILTNGARFYAMYDLNVRVVDKPEGSRYIQRNFVLDDEMLSLAEELLDEERESWHQIFVEGDMVSMTVVDPDPITMMMLDEYYMPNHQRSWWVIGFAKVDPTMPLTEVPTPHWEPIGTLISKLIATL